MAEKQIPAITQLGEKVGINVEKPQHGLHISGSGTGIALHIENGSENSDVLRIKTNGGTARTMTFQPDHIYTDGNLHLQVDSGQIYFRGAGHHFGSTSNATEKLELTGNFKIHGNNSAFSNFTSGYIGGGGWRINYDGTTSNLEVDNITVRNTLQTHIFQKDIVKAVNGFLYISDSGVIISKSISEKKVTFGTASATFNDNDLLWYKDVNPNTGDINSVYFRINGSPSTTGNDMMGNSSYTYVVDELTGSFSDLVDGGTAVRVSGGSILLDASSPNSPFMDVINNNTTYVRTGNLAGITSNNLGSLDGFGFWASGSAYLEGGINATSGNIAGWTIDNTKISKGNIKLDAGNTRITAGTLTSVDPNTSNYGFFVDASGNLLIKGNEANKNYIKFTTSALDIQTEKFVLNTDNLDIDSENYSINIGTSVQLSGSANTQHGQINIGDNVKLKGTGTSTITGDMEIAGWTINQYRIQKDITAGRRLYLNTEANNTTSNIQEGLVLYRDNSDVGAGKVKVVRVGGLSNTSDLHAANDYGFQVIVSKSDASGFDNLVYLGGDSQNIAGWDITPTQIKKLDSNGGVVIDAGTLPNINVRTGSDSTTTRVLMGEVSANRFGFFGFDVGGVNKLFELSNQEQQIAGWSFDTDRFYNSSMALHNTQKSIMLGHTTTWASAKIAFSGSGEGKLADGGIYWDKDGNTVITGSVTIGQDVTVNADVAIGSLPSLPPDENLKGYWSFNSPTKPYWDNSGNMNTGLHEGVAWVHESGSGIAGGYVITQENGGVMLLDNTAVNHEYYQSYCGWFKPSGYPSDAGDGSEGRLLSRDWSAYWAWMEEDSYDSNGKAYLEIGHDGSHYKFDNGLTSGSWHFIAMTLDYASNVGIAYLYQPDGTLLTGSFSPGINPAVASDGEGNNDRCVTLACNSEDDDNPQETSDNWSGSIDEVRYYNKVLTENEIDALYLNPSGPRQTVISGDQISTGKIKSNNWPTYGSEYDLNEGTIKLGGESAPKFAVNEAGAMTASEGSIAGWTIDEKSINWNSANKYMYVANDAHAMGINTNYVGGKPVISVFEAGSIDFKVDLGMTLYNRPSHSGMIIWDDYSPSDQSILFEASVNQSGTRFTNFAGWKFDSGKIYSGSTEIDSVNERIKLGAVSDFTNDNSSNKGILMGKDGSDYEFFVGQEGAEYLFWDGSHLHIKTDNLDIAAQDIVINTSDFDLNATTLRLMSDNGGKMTLGSGGGGVGKIMLSGSGEGHLADGNIVFDKDGNTTITGSVTIAADVRIEGASGRDVVWFEDWSEYADIGATSGMNYPRYDGSGQGWYYYVGDTSMASFKTNEGAIEGDRVIELGDGGSGNDEVWITSNKLVPFNSHSLYELEARVKRTETSTNNKVYIGLTGFNFRGGLTNVNGAAAFGSQHYIALSQKDVEDSWTIVKGYVKGHQGRIGGGAGGQHNSITDPAMMSSGSGNSGNKVMYFAPLVIANYDNKAGSLLVDYIKVSVVNHAGTTISGDNIQTGVITSNNWPTDGSELDLMDGTIKLGGETNPDFAVNEAGAVTASRGKVGGWTITDVKMFSNENSSDNHMEINSSTGIWARPEASHSLQTFGAMFNFDIGTISIDAQKGGIVIDTDNNAYQTMGSGGGNYDDPHEESAN